MDKSEREKSAGLEEINELLKPEHFVGFDIDDGLMRTIDNKKKLLKMEISQVTGEPMEVEEPSIVKNDHVNEKRQSKSSSNSKSMNTSSSALEYKSEDDWQAIKSSVSPKVSSPKLEDIDLNDTTNKRWNSETDGSLIETPCTQLQSYNNMIMALEHVFKFLDIHEILSASRVCSSWNLIAMNNLSWYAVRLENSMVYDWERCVDFINRQNTHKLDTRCMLIPDEVEDFESFWLRFSTAMKRAQQLKFIELFNCPTHVVEDIIYSLPQIEVLNATSIKNPRVTIRRTNNYKDLMLLNLNYLGQMTNLTELKLKGLTGIKITSFPSFENLIHLNKFSLTSIESFPKGICQNFDTISDKIKFLEIGECNGLSKNFAVSLKRFVNLKSLRLENWCDLREQFVLDVFTVIRSLEKLNVLELINIKFTDCVIEELKKCDGIKALLIIPDHGNLSVARAHSLLIDCLKKLSNTLTHFAWGLTLELLYIMKLFLAQYKQNTPVNDNNLELSNSNETTNYISVLDSITKGSSEARVSILSLPDFKKLLDAMMPVTKTKIITVPFSGTVRVYLNEHFDDL